MASILERISITKYQRIQMYLNSLDENVEIKNKKDKIAIEKIRNIIDIKIKQIKRTNYILYFFYVGIYFSFISLFTQNFLLLSEIVSIFSLIISFFGTTIFFIGSYITSQVQELYYQDLDLLTAHIITIYLSNQTTSDSVLSDENLYNPFIEFFVKRGFINSQRN